MYLAKGPDKPGGSGYNLPLRSVKILKKREDTLKLSEQVKKYCGILLQIIEHFLLTATAAQVLRRVSNEKH